MVRHLLITVSLFGLCLAVAVGQETKKDPPKKGTEVEIHFMNGSTVRAQVQSDKLDITTPYGKLSIPIKDVRTIEFGSHMPEGHADKIQAAIKKLGSSAFVEREKAAAALVDLGPYSYGAVIDASRTPDAEIAKRAKEVVQKMQAKFAKKDLKGSADDRIITPTFPIVGRILTSNIKIKADYFGAVELSLADMRTLRSVGAVTNDADIAVDAAKYAQKNQWLATDFHVDGRTGIVITAKGQVDLAPESPGEIVVGPNGYRVGAGFGKKGGMLKTQPGLLIGKIGEDGATFVVGERYEGTPSAEGKLYLQINPSTYSQQSAGTYEVKASVKN